MSQNHWMLDVIVDLRSFATANGLTTLADHLGKTLEVASAEVASMNDKAGAQANGQQNKSGQDPEDPGGHKHS